MFSCKSRGNKKKNKYSLQEAKRKQFPRKIKLSDSQEIKKESNNTKYVFLDDDEITSKTHASSVNSSVYSFPTTDEFDEFILNRHRKFSFEIDKNTISNVNFWVDITNLETEVNESQMVQDFFIENDESDLKSRTGSCSSIIKFLSNEDISIDSIDAFSFDTMDYTVSENDKDEQLTLGENDDGHEIDLSKCSKSLAEEHGHNSSISSQSVVEGNDSSFVLEEDPQILLSEDMIGCNHGTKIPVATGKNSKNSTESFACSSNITSPQDSNASRGKSAPSQYKNTILELKLRKRLIEKRVSSNSS